MFRALVVEDDEGAAQRIKEILRGEWPEADVCRLSSGIDATRLVDGHGLSLVVLDLAVRAGDGLDALRAIRRVSSVPMVAIVGAGDGPHPPPLSIGDGEGSRTFSPLHLQWRGAGGEAAAVPGDAERALSLGADEYVVTPFCALELLARATAVVHLSQATAPTSGWPPTFDDGFLAIDPQDGRARRAGVPVSLSRPELSILTHLIRHPGVVVPFRTLLVNLWGHDREDETAYLRVFVRRLREKIERDPDSPRYVVGERGLGYRFGVYDGG